MKAKKFHWTVKQKKALLGSVKKWEKIAYKDGEDKGPQNCPCCKHWFNVCCDGCPIMEFTGATNCEETPYDEWDDETNHKVQQYTASTPKLKKLAIKELKFLKRVLKAGS